MLQMLMVSSYLISFYKYIGNTFLANESFNAKKDLVESRLNDLSLGVGSEPRTFGTTRYFTNNLVTSKLQSTILIFF